MAARAQQHSATSLARYATAKAPGVDPFNGSSSRVFCNSFWGTGDSGPNIIFARMRGTSKTTDELRNFWNERCQIEEEYAAKLSKLAKAPIGGDEIGELRTSLDTLRIETDKQATTHLELATQIRTDLEERTASLHQKQITHRRQIQAPMERKFKEKQNRESYVKKSREKYEGDCMRITSYTQQASYMQGTDLAKIQQRLQRTQLTLQANEKDFAKFSEELEELLPTWEKEWKEFCDSCQDVDEERIETMKDIIWAYANFVSTLCVADDLSCERVRTALDQLEAERDVDNFVQEYGTGNSIVRPAHFVESGGIAEPQLPGPPVVRYATYDRVTKRNPLGVSETTSEIHSRQHSIDNSLLVPPHINGDTQAQSPHVYESAVSQNGYVPVPVPAPAPALAPVLAPSRSQAPSPPQTSPPNHPPPPIPEASSSAAAVTSRSPSPAQRPNRISQPLPTLPGGGSSSRGPERPRSPPPPLPQSNNHILFYVKALYDYAATIDEEFDFQTGDVIAVTATPDDGWWSGELLDEARRVEGRNIFPSNFVCLF